MPGSKFKILEHTADFMIEVYGKNLKTLFINAAQGMFFYMAKPKKGKLSKSRFQEIKIKSLDKESLLVDFLNELLYLSMTKDQFYSEIKIEKLTNKELEAKIRGIPFEKTDLNLEIKAATFYNLKIRKNKIWKTAITFDI